MLASVDARPSDQPTASHRKEPGGGSGLLPDGSRRGTLPRWCSMSVSWPSSATRDAVKTAPRDQRNLRRVEATDGRRATSAHASLAGALAETQRSSNQPGARGPRRSAVSRGTSDGLDVATKKRPQGG